VRQPNKSKSASSGETALAAICESKEGRKSVTDSEKVGICSESKSSISSISSPEDIEDSGEMGKWQILGQSPEGRVLKPLKRLRTIDFLPYVSSGMSQKNASHKVLIINSFIQQKPGTTIEK
jgi:isopentenyl diphosphate isomerase/L-lactate dehydrogenase-like FMN-dependent dehydrogenase